MTEHADTIIELAGHEDDCPECDGQGAQYPPSGLASDSVDCTNCHATGKVPRIRVSDGKGGWRTLRRECAFCKGNPHRTLDGVDYVDEGVIRDNVPVTCGPCDGRGWVPVDEDTAVVVCLEWLFGPTVAPHGMLYSQELYINPDSRLGHYQFRCHDDRPGWQIGYGDTLPAAVFAAAREVSDE